MQEVAVREHDAIVAMGREVLTRGGAGSLVSGAMAEVGSRTVFLWLLLMPSAVTVDPGSQRVQAGHFVFSGQAGTTHTQLSAVVAHGALGAGSCTRDDRVALPRFSFSCPIDASDATAWVQLFALERGRRLSSGVATILAVKDPATAALWTRIDYVEPAPMPANDRATALLALVNRVRVSAGLTGLLDLRAQRATVASIAPHYFSAVLNGEAERIDFLCLGLMAGWDVDEMTIGDGGFASTLNYENSQLDQLLGALLDSPSARFALLDGRLAAAALAVQEFDGNGIGVLIASYRALLSIDSEAAGATLFKRLDQLRRAQALPALERLPVDAAMTEARQLLAVGTPEAEIIDTVLHRVADDLDRSVHGWFIDTQDLDEIVWPRELLTDKKTYLAVAVASRKLAAAAWGSHGVLLVAFVDKTGTAKLAN
jgi:hypothetical protein